jgi:GNAT superfamily N-acetyltransferase
MDVRELTGADERREAVPILRQLWDDADPEAVMEWTADDDYHLLGGFVDGDLRAVAGVLVTDVLHHDRHAWLYDLVVDADHRGEGHGTALLDRVERWAEDRDCAAVALASPLSKESVHEYYADRGYDRWGYVVEKRLG